MIVYSYSSSHQRGHFKTHPCRGLIGVVFALNEIAQLSSLRTTVKIALYIATESPKQVLYMTNLHIGGSMKRLRDGGELNFLYLYLFRYISGRLH